MKSTHMYMDGTDAMKIGNKRSSYPCHHMTPRMHTQHTACILSGNRRSMYYSEGRYINSSQGKLYLLQNIFTWRFMTLCGGCLCIRGERNERKFEYSFENRKGERTNSHSYSNCEVYVVHVHDCAVPNPYILRCSSTGILRLPDAQCISSACTLGTVP